MHTRTQGGHTRGCVHTSPGMAHTGLRAHEPREGTHGAVCTHEPGEHAPSVGQGAYQWAGKGGGRKPSGVDVGDTSPMLASPHLGLLTL